MKKFILICFTLFVPVFAQENIEFFDPNQLQKGMQGYALTVMQGTEPEKIDLEVIAFMPNRLTKAGMVLVRLHGENVERTRVAAGMSGSPVYIDGKLVGALAYTWANARELLAGIVPIQDMISDKTRSGNAMFVPQEATPIQTAWAMDGFESDDFLQKLQDIDQNSQYPSGIEEFITVPSSRSNGVAPLKPGDAVAIKLVEGDINLASIGTVTYVDGEDVYIYGHPMDSEGPVSLPLARAEIFDIMPSTRLSFKMGRALPETIGSTVFDGMSSVYGRFDKQATMIPVTIHVRGKEFSNTYNMNMARSRKYLPTLIKEGVSAVLTRELGKNIEKQVKLSWNLTLTNHQTISNEVSWARHSVYDPELLSGYWQQYISILWNNSLTHLVPDSMEFTLDILEKPYDYHLVEEVKIAQKQYFAGDKVDIKVVTQKHLANTHHTNLTLELPRDTAEGTYSLIVGSQLAIERELAMLFPEQYRIRTVNRLLEELRKPINTHMLQAVLVDVSTGSVISGKFFEPMPKSKQSLFKSRTGDWQNLYTPRLSKTELLMNDPVLGGDVINIDIIRR